VTDAVQNVVMRIGLVGCVATKANEPRPARDLYISPLFRGRRTYVERTCERWFILSAKHGLVSPERVLEPYDETLRGISAQARRRWSQGVLAKLQRSVGHLGGHTFEIHAGVDYRNFGLVAGLHAKGAKVDIPTEGLRQGEQLAFYNAGARVSGGSKNERVHQFGVARARPGGNAELLPGFLGTAQPPLTLSFAEIERIIGRALPPSARRHRAWWANSPSHPVARQWLAAGWRADAVNIGEEWIRLTR
jgi:hypothetical protein